jgi:phosphoglycerate dehydrogenase-like enzyme
MMRGMNISISRCLVLVLALSIGGAPEAAAQEGLLVPEGISVSERDDGRNQVRVDFGDQILFADAPFLPMHRDMDRSIFMVQTGDGDKPLFRAPHILLVPEERSSVDRTASATRVTIRSRFAIAGGGREVVILSLGRRATAADAVVWLPQEKAIITGRLCDRTGVAATPDSDSRAWVDALHDLLDLEPSIVIPGRGAPGGPELLADQVDRLTAVRAAVEKSLLNGVGEAPAEAEFGARWYAEWRAEEPDAARQAFHGVYAEIGGLRPPWQLLEDRKLREGPAATGAAAPGWIRPTRVLWRNSWPERIAMLKVVAPGVEIVPYENTEEALSLIGDADALIGSATAELVAAGSALRWVQVGSAGVERYLAIPKLGSGEVVLTNGQRLASQVIAEHVMALTRALARGLNRAVTAQNEGAWRRSEIGNSAPLTKLRGKTLLVVGLGGIGTEVARLADAAGMRVTAIRNSRRSGPPFVASVGLAEELPAYIEGADVVVNCLPMTPDTTGFFDRPLFAAMKPTAFFVNVGRGGTVDTDALIQALENGEIAGAGLDVTDPEPLPEDHPLWKAPNLIITPHFAAWSDDDSNLRWLLYRENLRRFAAGEPLLSVVDPSRGY